MMQPKFEIDSWVTERAPLPPMGRVMRIDGDKIGVWYGGMPYLTWIPARQLRVVCSPVELADGNDYVI